MSKFLDKTGLSHLWDKIKVIVLPVPTTDTTSAASVLSRGTGSAGDDTYDKWKEITNGDNITIDTTSDTSKIKISAVDTSYETLSASSTSDKSYVVKGGGTAGYLKYDGTWDTPENEKTPVGTIVMYGGSTAPLGWLLCDGSDITSMSEYNNLKTVIGTIYDPDGTKYLLPNLSGRFPLGANNSTHTLGSTGGEETHLLTSSESGAPAHEHYVVGYKDGLSSTDNYRFIEQCQVNDATGAGTITSIKTGYYIDWNQEGEDKFKAYETYNGQAASTAHNNMPPYLTLNFIIKY